MSWANKEGDPVSLARNSGTLSFWVAIAWIIAGRDALGSGQRCLSGRLTPQRHPGKEPAFIRNGCGAREPAPPIGKNPARFLGS